jgi:hypothetical protein
MADEIERRMTWAFPLAVCERFGDAVAYDEPSLMAEIKCPNGHWTWEDGKHCAWCGVKVKTDA